MKFFEPNTRRDEYPSMTVPKADDLTNGLENIDELILDSFFNARLSQKRRGHEDKKKHSSPIVYGTFPTINFARYIG